MEKTDVLVIGSGLAGWTAAFRARELGARVLLAEKTEQAPGWNNSRIASGALHAALLNPKDTPANLAAKVFQDTDGEAIPELVEAWSHNVGRALDWLRDHGAKFIKAGPHPAHQYVFAPPGLNRVGLHWEGRGMDVAMRTLQAGFVKAGGDYRPGTAATELLTGDEAVTGAVLSHGGNSTAVEAGSVILADGGFSANPEMVRRFISPAPEKLKLRGADSATGDGIRMAEALGAQLVEMQWFYGHCLHIEALQNDRLWPYPWLDYVVPAGIVVQRNGRRLIDEGLGGIASANNIARLPDPQSCLVIFDQAVWEGPATELIVPPNPNMQVAGATLPAAGTLADLAAMVGVEAVGLEATAREYNAAVRAGSTDKLPVPRTARYYKPFPVERPPFYAIPIVPGITYTMGGLLTDGQARVLHRENRPIPGLYAAGGVAGGIEGGPRAGYVGGLSLAATFGLLAAEAAVAKAIRA